MIWDSVDRPEAASITDCPSCIYLSLMPLIWHRSMLLGLGKYLANKDKIYEKNDHLFYICKLIC